MIERKLSKSQGRVFLALHQQKMELQAAYQEVIAAEGEQIEMLRKHFELPEGEYIVKNTADGGLVMVQQEPKKDEPETKKEDKK
jgi:hypothetical protein